MSAARASCAPSCELEEQGVASRLRFALRWRQIRRDPVEGIKLAAARVLGVW